MTVKIRAAAVLAAALLLLPLLSGCGLLTDAIVAKLGPATADLLVSGELNAMYKGEFSKEYLEWSKYTEEELTELRQEYLLYEAEFLANYCLIANDHVSFTDLSPSLQDALVELCDAMYRATKYSFEAAVAKADGTYTVQATIEPVDLVYQFFQKWEEGEYKPMEDFIEKYTEDKVLDMNDVDPIAFFEEYGWIVVNCFRELLPGLGYMEAKTQVIKVETEDGLWINDDDFQIFNSSVIYYP